LKAAALQKEADALEKQKTLAEEAKKEEAKAAALAEKQKEVDTEKKQAAQKEKQRKMAMQQSNIIQIENLPNNFSNLMLDELIKNYPGMEKIVEADGPKCRAVVSFNSADSAKFAVMGLNRFKVDQSGRQLKVTFMVKE